MASSTVSTVANSTYFRKPHSRRVSAGQICTACDQCYRCKVRCSGERPLCERCRNQNSPCTYSTGKPLGKPKGSKNKVQRSKSTNKVGAKQPVALVDIAIKPDWSQLSPILKSEPSPFISDPMASYIDEATTEPKIGRSDGVKVEEIFPSAELNLDIDAFDWSTLVGETPTAANVEISSVSTMAAPPALSLPRSSAAGDLNVADGMAASTHRAKTPFQILTPISPRLNQEVSNCLCDPHSLGLISELHDLQQSFPPVDTALSLARRGLHTVSSYLSCPSCLSRSCNSPSLFLACVLILQQVFACYLTIRLQGAYLLEKGHSLVSIGDFEIEGEEGRNGVLDAIVRAEMEKGRGIIGGLENCVERAGTHRSDRVAGVLLNALREEIGWTTAAC